MDLLGAVAAVLMQIDRREAQKFVLTAIYKGIASLTARKISREVTKFSEKKEIAEKTDSSSYTSNRKKDGTAFNLTLILFSNLPISDESVMG